MRIVISGNIGCSKTTQIELLEKQLPKNTIFPEEVDKWIKEGWLQNYYDNKRKYATGFQFRTLKSHIKLPLDNSQLNIIERSPDITQNVFCQQLVEDGDVSAAGYRAVCEYNSIYGWKPDCYIYIRTPPEICYQRMMERSREAELLIKLDYLQKLHEKHEIFHKNSKIETHIIDGTQTREQINKEIMEIISQKMLERSGFINQDKS